MSIEEFKEKMKRIQNVLLEFLEDESNTEENYENFVKTMADYQINEDKQKVKSILQLINAIGNNHQRCHNFHNKIEKILEQFKSDIQKYFSNLEIFELFKNSKRILLFLIEEKIIELNENIIPQITYEYTDYFWPEIKHFLNEEIIKKFIEEIMKEVPEDFYNKRKEGENDNYLCELIRKNQVKEFGAYVNRNNISLKSSIERSVFETNQLLVNKTDINLIEYASFYGSNDIIRYMRINGNVELTPNMWIFAIHSRNSELIKYLEDNHVSPPEDDYNEILKESIKCHHNDVSKYIIDYLIKEKDPQNSFENNLYQYAVEFYNYCFFPENMKHRNIFLYLCEYDYYSLVNLYLKEENIDINTTIKNINILNDI
ncbi:hypothetical protein M9Y10_006279 [Tritrichomonas musculus]|uniref:DUF3447 domain-containing protein n=1 Tax=Tritrichomonas musculus TaxID=1915356 RepID=A0ABR2JEX3_9EUKA